MNSIERTRQLLAWTLAVLLLIYVICWLFFVLAYFFVITFIERDVTFVASGLSAFAGAFAAFVFLILERVFGKTYSRFIRHRNALVAIELKLGKFGEILSANVSLLDGFAKAVSDNVGYITTFRPLVFDERMFLELKNIDFINEVFSYSIDLDRLQHDLELLSTSYARNRQLVYDGKITTKEFKEQMSGQILQEIAMIKAFAQDALDKNTELQAKVRILLRGPGLYAALSRLMARPEKYLDDMEAEVVKEMDVLRAEQQRSLDSSKRRTESILRKLSETE